MTKAVCRRSVLAAMGVVALVAAGCGSDDSSADAPASPATTAVATTEEMMGDETMGDVLATAADEGDLGTFLAATEAAGIMDGLHGPGPFTVFAPTDEAFGEYLAETGMSQADVFADPAAVRELVEQHIVNESEDADMVMSMAGESFTTAAGTPLEVTVDGDTVMVGDATVVRYDLEASNGVIHVIDAVLAPAQP